MNDLDQSRATNQQALMTPPITFTNPTNSNIDCTIHLDVLYPSQKDREAFDKRWVDFLSADEGHAQVLRYESDTITYPHKSWLPEKQNGKPALLLLFGNPAPHSVVKDVYFAYEGSGTEHRFWKVLRELGFTDLSGSDANIKAKFLNLEHQSPFRLGFEVIYTFPTSASKPKWSGVMGMEKLFGKKAMALITEVEKQRVQNLIKGFAGSNGAIIALQKDAYNAIADNKYDLKLAVEGQLVSSYAGTPIYGTPPTRWLYTAKMKQLLTSIKDGLVAGDERTSQVEVGHD